MFDITKMCNKLAAYHWSPKPPKDYVMYGNKGIGPLVVEKECYGAFNLVWAIQPSIETVKEHISALNLQSAIRPLMDEIIHDVPLGDWLTLMNPREFRHWYDKNSSLVSKEARKYIDQALTRLFATHV